MGGFVQDLLKEFQGSSGSGDKWLTNQSAACQTAAAPRKEPVKKSLLLLPVA
jgi:hypothetical protein